MQDSEQANPPEYPEDPKYPEHRDRLRNVLIVAGAYTACVLFYKVLFNVGLGHSSLLFIGIPGVLAILLALVPPAGTAKGSIVKGITFALLIIAPLVGEGYLCILMAAPLFYAIGLAIGAGIDVSRDRTTTLRCSMAIVMILSLDGIVPVRPRQEVVSVVRVVPASAEEVRAALARPVNILAPLPRFLRIGFPHPLAASGSGLSVGSTRTVRFSGAEGDPAGDLTLRVAQANERSAQFVATGDTSKLTQWILWRSSAVEWQPIDSTHTRVRWQVTFDRQLDPWWYFEPWERYAVRKAAEYLIVASATPSASLQGEHQ
jgi:hypothetical protein